MSYTYCLRSVRSDMTSKNGFVWPESGLVTCPDWNPKARCGNGLHGLMLGQDDPGEWYEVAMVVRVETAKIVDLDHKCKFPECEVVYVGDMAGATSFFNDHGGAEGLYRRTQIGGDESTLTGGDCSTLTGGRWSTLTGGDESTLTGGDCSTLTGGRWSTLTGGDESTLTGGHCSTLMGGDWSQLICKWHDGTRRRARVYYVGKDGIKPNTPYRNESGVLVEVQP